MTPHFQPEIKAFAGVVLQRLIARHGVETGDSEAHALSVMNELISRSPTTFSAFVMAKAAGADADAVVDEGLATLDALEANALAAADPYKTIYRLLLRRAFPNDLAFADATADRASVTEARENARVWADRAGVRIDDLRGEAEALRAAEAEAAAAAEQRRLAKEIETRRRRDIEALTEGPRKQQRRRRLV